MPNINKSRVLDVTLRRSHWVSEILRTYGYVVTLMFDGSKLFATGHPRKHWLPMVFRTWEGSSLRSLTYSQFVKDVWIMINRRSKVESNGSSQAPVNDPKFASKMPTLLSYLQDDKYADGSPRLRSTVSFFIKDSQFRCSVNDKDLNEVLWVASDTWDGLLKALETALASPDAQWRPQAEGKPWGARKRPPNRS